MVSVQRHTWWIHWAFRFLITRCFHWETCAFNCMWGPAVPVPCVTLYYCCGCVSKSTIHTLTPDILIVNLPPHRSEDREGYTATFVPLTDITRLISTKTHCWCSLELSNCWESCSMKWFPEFCNFTLLLHSPAACDWMSSQNFISHLSCFISLCTFPLDLKDIKNRQSNLHQQLAVDKRFCIYHFRA